MFNRDIVIVLGNELLTDLEGSVDRVFCACLTTNEPSCWLATRGCREHGLSFIHVYPSVADLFSSLLTVDWLQLKCFSSSSGVQPPTIPRSTNNFLYFTLTNTVHVYHICLAMSEQTILAIIPRHCWTTSISLKMLLPFG